MFTAAPTTLYGFLYVCKNCDAYNKRVREAQRAVLRGAKSEMPLIYPIYPINDQNLDIIKNHLAFRKSPRKHPLCYATDVTDRTKIYQVHLVGINRYKGQAAGTKLSLRPLDPTKPLSEQINKKEPGLRRTHRNYYGCIWYERNMDMIEESLLKWLKDRNLRLHLIEDCGV